MIRFARHALFVVLAALPAFFSGRSQADAAAPFVVADVATGRVLLQEDATMPWHPASVTKLMTAYVALRREKEGRIGFDTPIPVSLRAAGAAPSKIGVKPGQEVTLDNALKMLLVKSANDMAVVIAEGVGGSVEAFADMMNAEAERLGMRESHFVNPNGLFADGQQTSARDMAVLARALLIDFPGHRDLFSIGAVQLGPRIMKNTNGLVGRYPGIEGMKTGFICASGFNLVAVASRNGQKLVAVVMGQASAADRTIRAAQLLDKGFGSSGFNFFGGGPTLDQLPSSGVASAPNMREDICMRRKGPPPSETELDANAGAVSSTLYAFRSGDDGWNTSAPQTASAASSVRGAGPRALGPRAEFEPIPVFVGRAPGSGAAPLAANAKPGASSTATAYAADKAKPEGAAAADGPLKLRPAATVPLAGAKAKGQAQAGKVAAKPSEKPVAKTAAKPAAAAKPVATKADASKAAAVAPAKAKAKPAATAKASGAKSAAAEAKPTPARKIPPVAQSAAAASPAKAP